MRCIYCDQPTNDACDEHEECATASMVSAVGWRAIRIDGGVKVVTTEGCEVVIRLDTHDGVSVLALEPQAGTSLEGEEPGIYYVVPAR